MRRSRRHVGVSYDDRCDIEAEVIELRDADGEVQRWEERVRMDEQQALAPLDDEHLGVPVVAVWLGVNRRASPTAY